MGQLKSRAALLLSVCAAIAVSTGCTPEYVRQQGKAAATDAHLLDSISVERRNQRVLSPQTYVCLMSGNGGEEVGADLLRSIQVGFSGYFRAVGVVGESIDYLRAVSTDSCPGASYLFYVQSIDPPVCDDAQKCKDVGSQYVFTILSGEGREHTLVDRVEFAIKNSFLPSLSSDAERRQKAFERLAKVLTGAK